MLLAELLLVALAVSRSVSYDRSVNYWEAFAPGKLLQRLDALTLNGDVQPSKISQLPKMVQVQAQAKADEDLPDDEAQEDSLSAETSHEAHSGEDYEHNYENFVKEYFDRATDASDEDNENAGSLETEASNIKHQQCRQVKRKGQLCEICHQTKNNEVSETCSYSHANEPEQYAYDQGSQYKRYRDQGDNASKEQVEEETSSPGSLCVRRLQNKRVCYECKDSMGKRLERCYDTQGKNIKKTSQVLPEQKKKKARTQQSKHSKQDQRIYKRTISYSYAQGSNSDPKGKAVESPESPTTRPSPKRPPHRGRLVKIMRRRGQV